MCCKRVANGTMAWAHPKAFENILVFGRGSSVATIVLVSMCKIEREDMDCLSTISSFIRMDACFGSRESIRDLLVRPVVTRSCDLRHSIKHPLTNLDRAACTCVSVVASRAISGSTGQSSGLHHWECRLCPTRHTNISKVIEP